MWFWSENKKQKVRVDYFSALTPPHHLSRERHVSVSWDGVVFSRVKTRPHGVFVCTRISRVATQSKCHVFTGGHMLIDYRTALTLCGSNPRGATQTCTVLLRKGLSFLF